MLLLLTSAAALFANVLRAAALFIVETRDSPVPQFIHPTIGAATFALIAVTVCVTLSRMR
jgi:hypothetical protein